MKTYLFIWFWLLTFFALVSGVNAETEPFIKSGQSSYFQWKMLRGLDTEWKGWKIHLGGQLAADAITYDKDNKKEDGLRWETVNLRITGSYGNKFSFFIEPDLLGIDTKSWMIVGVFLVMGYVLRPDALQFGRQYLRGTLDEDDCFPLLLE